MFLTQRHSNNSISKNKKTFITLTSRSKSHERNNSQTNVTRDRDKSEERFVGNIGCETAVSLNYLQTERAEKAAKRQAYLSKNRKTHKMASLVLDCQQFQQYRLQEGIRTLWNHDSPINKLSDYLQRQA